MSYTLLFEMAAAIGTQRMVELCEHYLWTTDTLRRDEALRQMLDSSGAILPPAWRRSSLDRGSRWEDCSGSVTLPSTPVRSPSPLVCPGAPARPRPPFQSPALAASATGAAPPFSLLEATPPSSPLPRTGDLVADHLAEEGWHREVVRRLKERDFSLGWERGELLEELRSFDPLHPLLCPLHNAQTAGSLALGYSRNSSGYYSTFAPCCNGCHIGMRESGELDEVVANSTE